MLESIKVKFWRYVFERLKKTFSALQRQTSWRQTDTSSNFDTLHLYTYNEYGIPISHNLYIQVNNIYLYPNVDIIWRN